MGIIYQRNRVYYIDYRLAGRRIRRRIGPSRRLADLALKDIEVKIARNELGFPAEEDGHTFGEFFSHYMEFCGVNHSPATTQRYKAIVDNFLSFLEKTRPEISQVSQLSPNIFDDYKIYRKKQLVMPNGEGVDLSNPSPYAKRGAKANTINMELGTLRTIFNQGIKWGHLKKNPTEGVEMLKVTDAKPPRFLTQEESKKLLENCGEKLYPVFFTFLNTGMRLSELLNLEWSDIDFQRRKIKIQRKPFWSPKTGEREIPMNAGMYVLLQNLKEEKSPGTSLVFPTGNGKGYKKNLGWSLSE